MVCEFCIISRSSQELWAKCTKSGQFAGISESSLPMVRNLKALMYSGSINSANFASFAGSWGELHEICIIRWNFCRKQNLNLKILLVNLKILLMNLKMKKQMCTVKPYYILAEKLGLFAMRLPSLSQGNVAILRLKKQLVPTGSDAVGHYPRLLSVLMAN